MYGGEESLLVFLACLGSGMTYVQLADSTFGGDPRRFSDMFRFMVNHLYKKIPHKLTSKSLSL